MRASPASIAGLLLVGACASIMHGTSQDVGISSTPVGATVTVDNQPAGVTPVVAHLKRGDNHTIKIQMDGYQPFAMTTTRKVSGWVWGNIVFGGLIGLAVDAADGGLYDINPDQVVATLPKGTATRVGPALMISVVMQADPSWHRIGTLQRQ